MADSNVTFAKVVANPNTLSWSQAYNAGKLFAVISLTVEKEEEKDYLNVLGKEILDTLEQEFFSLETKNLESIKQAVTVTSEKIPTDVDCSFVVATYVGNVLYLYILGGGKISLKRGEKLGTLLVSEESDAKSLRNASGYLQNGDIIVLQTKQFEKVVSTQMLSEFISDTPPADIAEHLAPLVHEKDEAGAAGIILKYQSDEEIKEEKLGEESNQEETLKNEVKDEVAEEEKPSSPFYSSSIQEEKLSRNKIPLIGNFFMLFKSGRRGELNHPRKVILTILILILIVFIGSIIFAVKKQQDSKTTAIFDSVYPQASKKYEEGKSLLGLNEGLAQDSFDQAKQLLDANINKLPKGSSGEIKLQDLLNQVNQQLSSAPKPNSVSAKAVDSTSSNLLNAEIKNSGLYFTIDSSNIYMLTSGAIYTLKLDGTGKNSIVTNSNDWTSPAGFSNYYGNLYVLDKKQNQILKFVESNSSYSKSNYFSDTTGIDFSKAISMTIDSSVYVLTTDGKIQKFNKGESVSFNITGLDKEFSNPTRIFTTTDDNYVYILDNGNSRIVVLDKNGKYKAQYSVSQIKAAKDFDVDETNNKAYILSGGKVYEISLK